MIAFDGLEFHGFYEPTTARNLISEAGRISYSDDSGIKNRALGIGEGINPNVETALIGKLNLSAFSPAYKQSDEIQAESHHLINYTKLENREFEIFTRQEQEFFKTKLFFVFLFRIFLKNFW